MENTTIEQTHMFLFKKIWKNECGITFHLGVIKYHSINRIILRELIRCDN